MPRTGVLDARSPRSQRSEGGTSTLAVLLRREARGPVLAVGLVTRKDLVDARAELWFEAFLRRGHLDMPFEAVEPRLLAMHRPARDADPGEAVDSHGPAGQGEPSELAEPICVGFQLRCPGAPGDTGDTGDGTARCFYPRSSLEGLAARLARGLVESGKLKDGDLYHFELRAGVPEELASMGAAASPGASPDSAVRVATPAHTPSEPFSALRRPLAPLRERATEIQPKAGVPGDYPVFFTRAARRRAEVAARRGAAARPPVETGGLLIGPLCSCPETGEMFAVVVDVLEAAHATGTTYSLTYSGKTWARIQAVMRAKAAHPATRHQRILGQVHGHSFLPMEGALPCEDCEARSECTRTTAFLSSEDLTWCRAVFRGEPWQLSQVFGLDARGRGVEAFFGQSGGRLVRRSYYVLDDSDHGFGRGFEHGLEQPPGASPLSDIPRDPTLR